MSARGLLLALALLGAAPAGAEAPGLPMERGLPVVVRTGLAFAEIGSVDEAAGTFTGTVDLRLRWVDARLRFPAGDAPGGYREWRGAAAEEALGSWWTPDVRIANLVGEPTGGMQGVRLSPDGGVEWLRRTSGAFALRFDVGRFPFDRQDLVVELLSERDPQDRVTLDFRQDDLDFSRVAPGVDVDGWTVGLVDVKRRPQPGWHGQSHARLRVALDVSRRPATAVAPIFIPLVASLLIPLLALWLNKMEGGEPQIEAFELANILIGGLFAVIALNFTVNAEYPSLGSTDNPVSRLFGLNYLTLAASLAVNVVVFRYQLVRRAFGRFVQDEVYRFLNWALPAVALGSAAAILLAASA